MIGSGLAAAHAETARAALMLTGLLRISSQKTADDLGIQQVTDSGRSPPRPGLRSANGSECPMANSQITGSSQRSGRVDRAPDALERVYAIRSAPGDAAASGDRADRRCRFDRQCSSGSAPNLITATRTAAQPFLGRTGSQAPSTGATLEDADAGVAELGVTSACTLTLTGNSVVQLEDAEDGRTVPRVHIGRCVPRHRQRRHDR